jgi:hypothetical protein
MNDERRAEIEAEAAKALRERFGRLGILSRAVVYDHPSGEEIARVVLDVADRVRDGRGDDEPRTEAEPRTVARWLHAKAEAFGLMSDSLAFANAGRAAIKQVARAWQDEFPADRRVPAARSPQGEDHVCYVENGRCQYRGCFRQSPKADE